MREFKCCLRGAYGPGNFGDDLLLISSLNILERIYDKKDIAVTVHDISKAEKFLPHYNLVPFSSPVKSEVTFLGGGGQYFSFSSNLSKKKTKFEKISSLLNSGMTLTDFISGYYIRKRFNRRWISNHDVGFCLGLGPFENEHDRLYDLAKIELPNFSYLSVRDSDSFKLSESIGVRDVKKFSDPIFNSDLWKKDLNIISSDTNDVAIIIRDWPFDQSKNELVKKLINLVPILESKGLKPKFVSLYADYDKNVIEYFQDEGFEVITWDPVSTKMDEFLSFLNSCKCIITTRAHGAIVPSMLGVPTVIINIEHKLKKVHEMLLNSSYLMELESVSDSFVWDDIIEKYLTNRLDLVSGLFVDLKRNSIESTEAAEDILNFLQSVNH
ncbi:polysaccharide pyruvyl transferase family protein [Photobacterium sp. WH77]|uniref:polysaccharide pyruvyl transferase family protein n=1 Tax=unclassified Photobacterium TaxID=2628852 RepID=UPI001EDA73D1|nr:MULTISPECIES: polysaccharide pyruvyl transferase family protein [unclassified Photobacterium]MCG2835705.1 polysaccharide pyruvyl transferase family protein [Photobacterium sp. WH77]MCG2843318.1 polysaccharide pyruvyl transferase family protein [Photobacterium sp. WH80]